MIREGINGFCMALADSVPGVSGGTVAFIMGFYDNFIGSIYDIAFGDLKQKKMAIFYLLKLGIGWLIGMSAAVMVLSSLFESQIYRVSSLFIGFVVGAIPIIIMEEKNSLKDVKKGVFFLILGVVLVAGITWLNGKTGNASMNLSHVSMGLSVKLFFIGMIAISAMFLPGISGSTLLLIFGAYLPIITALKHTLSFDLSYVPSLICFSLGILTGALSVVKLIKVCLETYRTQAVSMILGMMVGSIYAIILGPTTLEAPKAALSFDRFHLLSAVIGVGLVLGMQLIKESGGKNATGIKVS